MPSDPCEMTADETKIRSESRVTREQAVLRDRQRDYEKGQL